MKKNTELIREGLNRGGQESREERQRKRLLRFRGGNLYRPPIEVYVPRSEYFYERDRYFIEQLLMQSSELHAQKDLSNRTRFHKI